MSDVALIPDFDGHREIDANAKAGILAFRSSPGDGEAEIVNTALGAQTSARIFDQKGAGWTTHLRGRQ